MRRRSTHVSGLLNGIGQHIAFLPFGEHVCVNEMPISHMTVLLTFLFESHSTSFYWAPKWLLSSMHSDMVFKGIRALAFSLAVWALISTHCLLAIHRYEGSQSVARWSCGVSSWRNTWRLVKLELLVDVRI